MIKQIWAKKYIYIYCTFLRAGRLHGCELFWEELQWDLSDRKPSESLPFIEAFVKHNQRETIKTEVIRKCLSPGVKIVATFHWHYTFQHLVAIITRRDALITVPSVKLLLLYGPNITRNNKGNYSNIMQFCDENIISQVVLTAIIISSL